MDGWLLLSGLATLLQQLHPQVARLSLLESQNDQKVGRQLVEKLIQARDSFTLASDHQEVRSSMLVGGEIRQWTNLVLLQAVSGLFFFRHLTSEH